MNLFIDTNIFLSFFHLTSDDIAELHKLIKLIEKGNIILWLPEQVKDEFRRNREIKISDAKKMLEEQKVKPQFPQICKNYDEYNTLIKLQKEYEKLYLSLNEKINNDIKSQKLKADGVINKLFLCSKIIGTTADLVAKAQLRINIGNPPGKNGSLGDAINWEALLVNVPENENLHIVTNDKDYFSLIDKNKLKEFLEIEWSIAKKSEIIIYRQLSQFFNDQYPEVKLIKETENIYAVKSLFQFLTASNPDIKEYISDKPSTLTICVSLQKQAELQDILNKLDAELCSGQDNHNIIINGGFGIGGTIRSVDPEPHTTFTLRLNPSFYEQLDA